MKKAKILVVEDEAIIAKDLQLRLESMDYVVPHVVATGEEAIRKAREIMPDLVLMDIMLRGTIDGIEAADRIHFGSDVPVVYLTSYADKEIIERAKVTNPFGYLIKPVGDKELYSSIELTLSKHQTEKTLKENEKWLSTVLSSIGDAVITTDTKGDIVLMNPAAEFLTGWNIRDAKGRPIEEICNIIDESTGARIKHPVAQVLKDRSAAGLSNHTVLVSRQGAKIPINDSCAPIQDDKNNFTGVVLVFSDMTEQKQAENFIKNILESVEEGFIVIDRNYRILSANRAFSASVKRPIEDIIGKLCFEVSHYIHKPCYETGEECPVKYTFDTGLPQTVVHMHYDKDAKPFYTEIRSYAMKDESGKFVSVIETINDITEKRKLESQLRHAQKMEAVGHLAGGVSHDFNNILTAITGYANLLKMKMKDDDPMKYNINQIIRSVERGANLTQSLLAFSRKQIMNPKPLDFNSIVLSVLKLLKRLIGEDIEMKTNLTKEKVTVMADGGQLEQVLMNLATNAKDAMTNGGIFSIETERIFLSSEYAKSHGFGVPGPYVLISVTDTGTGMDKTTMSQIFEPFFTTKEVRGTGLGLAMVYGIIKQHNGYINVYSEPGEGTAFKIYLPLTASDVETSGHEYVPPSIGGTETIMIAEDDDDARRLTTTVLEQFGYTVIEAKDGEEAIILFNTNKDSIKLLVLDVIMPKKNGKEVYEEIRKTAPDIRTIFTSGYTADIIHKKGVLEEDLNFISKPFSPQQILKKIRDLLDAKTGNRGIQ